jgi:hypothetical protein
VTGEIVPGLYKSVLTVPTDRGRRVTVCRYDPGSSPPVLLSENAIEIRDDQASTAVDPKCVFCQCARSGHAETEDDGDDGGGRPYQ